MQEAPLEIVLYTRKREVPYEVKWGPISEVTPTGKGGGSIREVLYARKHILLFPIRDPHNLEDQVSLFISHKNKVIQL
jgi:hypothetical protein